MQLFLQYFFLCFRYSTVGLPIAPHCSHNSKALQCKSLKSNDFYYFHKLFYLNKSKQKQDNLLIKHCNATSTNRKRPTTSTRAPKTLTIKYFIPQYKSGKLVPVCRETFLNILRLKKGRVQGVMKRYFENPQPATERRGGDRKKILYAAKREAIEKFIKTFKPLEIHYSREKNRNRVYLHPDLNIEKMWVMYNDQAQPDYGVTRGLFRLVFNTSFNIGFGSPRQDVCSTCLQLSETLKIEKDPATRVSIMTQARVHKLRAAAFFNYLKEDRDDLITLSFDCEKNLPLPKIPDQATYYARQLYIYNFTVVIGSSSQKLNKDNVHAYTWTENESSKGSNEICSSLFHCLNNIDLSGKNVVRMVADGCGGQNKNMMVIGMAMKWLINASNNIKTIEIIYPVTGHSFLPPDRVFALTEKQIRRLEIIVQPEEYRAIFSDHATVHKLVSDIPVLDWKETCKETLKPTQSWHFQISKCKRVILSRKQNTVLVRGEISYKNDLSTNKSILKRGKQVQNINPQTVTLGVAIKPAKLNDVRRLLDKHYGQDWENKYEHLIFYKSVLNVTENLTNYEENEDLESYNEEVLDFV